MNRLALSPLVGCGARVVLSARGPGAIGLGRRLASTQVEAVAAETGRDLTDKVQEVPQVSGAGPFPEVPTFEVLGNPSSLLRVTLPASSSIYTRRGSVVAVNGRAEGLTSTLDVDGSLRKLATGMPILYQKITSTSPATLVVADTARKRGPASSFAIISTTTPWIIAQRSALLGWTGTASVETNPGFTAWSSMRAAGSGQVAVVGRGQLFQVEVGDGEQIDLNPSNIVAYTEPSQRGQLRRVAQHLVNMDLPALESWVSRWAAHIPGLAALRRWSTAVATKLRVGTRLALRVKGPCTVLVQTHATPVRELFSSEELDQIVQQRAVDDPSSN